MAFLSGMGSLGVSKRTRKYAAVIGPALLAVGAVVAAPKLISYFKGQGVAEGEAELMAQEVLGGERPMPQNFDPAPATFMGMDTNTLKGMGIAAVIGVGAVMFTKKKR